MTEIIEDIKVSKITNKEISNANSKIDIEKLDDVEFRYIAIIIVLFLVILFAIGLKNDEEEKKEVYRRKRKLERKKKMNIHLDKDEVNKIWNEIYEKNKMALNE